MKKVVKVEEVMNEGLEGMLGEKVTLWCMNYIYSGVLAGLNDVQVMLTDAVVVYETGKLTDDEFKDAQPTKNPVYVRLSAVESYTKR